jgi:hypothetical protein
MWKEVRAAKCKYINKKYRVIAQNLIGGTAENKQISGQ